MELVEAIKARRSVRRFTDKPVDDNLIKQIIELGNLAPSAGNLQPRDFVIVKDENAKNQLAQAALNQKFISQAPVLIVVCANMKRVTPYGNRGHELYCLQDTAASIQNMLLSIVDLGLSSCWVGAFNENEVVDILDLPSYVRPVAILPIGYSDTKSGSSSRIPIEDLIRYEKW
ncbi:MAG: nitroreductase family protein [Promethearchaeota archaeon]|jgi:nitroreductase